MMNVRGRRAGLSLFLRLAGVLLWIPTAVAISQELPPEPTPSTQLDAEDLQRERELLRLFADTFENIRENYVRGDVTDRQLIEAAIRGMLAELDRHSNYIAPSDLDRFRTSVESEFGGVGIQVRKIGNQLQVVTPIFGTPAHRAGLMAGDIIISIDERDAAELTLDDAVQLMQGQIGSSVAMQVRHPGSETAEKVNLRRDIIHVETVLGFRRDKHDFWVYWADPEEKIAYVRLTAFSRPTAEELKRVLQDLQTQGLKGLILDLRFNPGGLLVSAVEICDLFLSEGTIVSTEGRNVEHRVWSARPEGTLPDFPLVVLVNRFSASASEIVAACLQDHARAAIVGERTWGKGSVQNVIELDGGRSALKLTTAGYMRPSGKNIDRVDGASDAEEWGVRPDDACELRMSLEELRRLDSEFEDRSVIYNDPERAASQPVPSFTDRQFDKALELLRQRLSTESPGSSTTTDQPLTPSSAR